MGNKNSTPKPKDYIKTNDLQVFDLKKRKPGCTGMFWRADPNKNLKLQNNNNWPRDGATLKGEVRTINGRQWLAATHVKQANSEWVEAPYGAHMPFEYDNHYYLEKTVE